MLCCRYSYEQIHAIADNILKHTKHRPIIGIICGSGLGSLADHVAEPEEISYSQIPEFPASTGQLVVYVYS
jgi:purine-nucleoside phosphorylase